jgi:D-alanyl-D-alanine dipeptidase
VNVPRFDHPELTSDPRQLVDPGSVPATIPLPILIEPDHQPPVLDPRDEPLVEVLDRRLMVVGAYSQAGWASARPGAWLREEALSRLLAAVTVLPDEFGLAIFDAWRPLALQEELYRAAYRHPGLPPGFVAPPSDSPTEPPPHLTGGTVDCTLTHSGRPLALGTGYDEFTPLSHAAAFEDQPGVVRELRRLLFWTMAGAGFVVLANEWWHFEVGTRRWASITGQVPRYGPASPPG